MSGPGWHCDGCGDYRCHDGRESYSVAQRDLRAEIARLTRELEEARSDREQDIADVRVRMLDEACKWLDANGHAEAAKALFAERLRFLLPDHPEHWHAPDCRLAAVLGASE